MVATVVSEAVLLTRATSIKSSAHLGSAARKRASHGPIVSGDESRAMSPDIAGPVLGKHICQFERQENQGWLTRG